MKQASQGDVNFWRHHRGEYSIPTPKAGPKSFKGGICPAGLALHHPAEDKLLKYATLGCPTKTGRNWTKAEMEEAIENGPHASALDPEAKLQLYEEVLAKQEKGQCRVVDWETIKDNPPEELKVSPIAMIPHKL